MVRFVEGYTHKVKGVVKMKKKSLNYLTEFEVSCQTMAIIPVTIGDSKYSRVLETDGEYIVAMKPIDIVEHSCRYFGSSLKGRREGTKELTGVTHKSPIIVEATSMIYLFPTASPTKPQCAWISHAHVLKRDSGGYGKTSVFFHNGKTISLPVSVGSFTSQLQRTAQLRTIMSGRLEKKERKMNFIVNAPNHNKPNLIEIDKY